MKIEEIREISSEEAQKKILELKQELFNMRFQKSMNQLQNPMRIRYLRKTIARINTVLRQKELQINS